MFAEFLRSPESDIHSTKSIVRHRPFGNANDRSPAVIMLLISTV